MEVYITENSIAVPTPKCQIREIALDGVYLPNPRRMHSGQSFIVPGSRVDWLVICHTPGTYKVGLQYTVKNYQAKTSEEKTIT